MKDHGNIGYHIYVINCYKTIEIHLVFQKENSKIFV